MSSALRAGAGSNPDFDPRSVPGRSERVKVVFIGGYSRSGSTLLDLMLGQVPGFFSTGELAYIWDHGLQQARLCGCGQTFVNCPFWTRVGQEAFGGWDSVDVDEMVALERAVNRHRLLPLLMAPGLRGSFKHDLERYAQVLSTIYRAIHVTAGARVIVDSTIDPAYGFLLRHVPNLDLRLVHMVRDSRATAFSWTRLQRRYDRVDSEVYQRRFRPPATAVRWMGYHALVHLLAAVGPDGITVRYEDVVRSPSDVIKRVVSHAGESVDDEQLTFLHDGSVELDVNHTIAGSQVRLRQGRVPVRLDDEWKSGLPASGRRAVTALTWPFLHRYGYAGRATRTLEAGTTGRPGSRA
jgi:Sulfotransferase family